MSTQYRTNVENNAALAKSLVIKSYDSAVLINRGIESTYGSEVDHTDPYTWKYYLNLSGELHITNNTVYIKTIEDGTTIELTKANLAAYPVTHAELLKFETAYTDIVNKQPDDELYVRGVIMPVAIDDAINAEDGVILNYSNVLLEEQEKDLIVELSEYSVLFMGRWRNHLYAMIDELYTSALMAILVSKLVLKITNLRLANINTHRVHSYYLKEFFFSNFGIESELRYIPKKTQLWLYLNFQRLRKHIGSNRTLETLVEKVITENSIGSSRYNIDKVLPQLNLEMINDPTLPIYDFKEAAAIVIPDNVFTELPYGGKDNVNNLVAAEFDSIENTILEGQEEKYLNEVESKSNMTNRNSARSKIINLRHSFQKEFEGNIPIRSVIDNWFYYADRGGYTATSNVTDPNTGYKYTLTPYQAMLVTIKLMAMVCANDNSANPTLINYIISGTVVKQYANEATATTKLLENLPDAAALSTFVSELMTRLPSLYTTPTVSSASDFANYINQIEDAWEYIGVTMSNVVEPYLYDQMSMVVDRCWEDNVVVDFDSTYLGANTIDEVLTANNIVVPFLENYDGVDLLDEITYAFTGVYLHKNERYEIIEAYRSLLTKMTSYTVQVLNDPKNKGTININSTLPLATASTRGVARISEGTFFQLEPLDGTLESVSINFEESINFEDDGPYVKTDANSNKPELLATYQYVGDDYITALDSKVYVPTVFVSTAPTIIEQQPV